MIVSVAALQPLQLLKKVAQNDKPWSRAWKAALLQVLIAPPPRHQSYARNYKGGRGLSVEPSVLSCLRRGTTAVALAIKTTRHGRAFAKTLDKLNLSAIITLILAVTAVTEVA